MPKPKIVDVMHSRLAGHPPESLETLGAEAKSLGLTTARDPASVVRDRLRYDSRFAELSDGRWTTLVGLIEGRHFTHRISEGEVMARGFCDGLDLGVPMLAVGSGLPVRGGGSAQIRGDWLTTQGTCFDEVRAGDLVDVRVIGGELDVVAVDDLQPTSSDDRRLADAIRGQAQDYGWQFDPCPSRAATSALLAAITADETLLMMPTQPLSLLVPEHASRPRERWGSDDPDGCSLRIDEACGCHRCRCNTVARLAMPIDAEVVYAANVRFDAIGASLIDHLVEAVRLALHTAPATQPPAGDGRVLAWGRPNGRANR